MTVPNTIRIHLKSKLWTLADTLGWNKLGQSEKAKHYENWTKDPDIGGRLARYMDAGHVRVYIKDTLLKEYGRVRLADPDRPLRAVGLCGNEEVAEEYIKPHGRRLVDGRVLCWGRAGEWKAILFAVHERAYIHHGQPYAAILMDASGRFHEAHERAVVDDAAQKLGISQIRWLE
jgi:hypothetical protein